MQNVAVAHANARVAATRQENRQDAYSTLARDKVRRDTSRRFFKDRGRSESPSEHPLDPTEKTSARSPLGSEDADAGSGSQLIGLIEYVRHVEPELERTEFFGQVKYVRKA
jgi:hypothetical protein